MNLKESTDEASSDVFFANFNHNCTVLCVGSKNVFSFYSLNEVEELEVIHGIVADDVRIIEGNFRSSIAAVVTVSAPRILKIIHMTKEKEIHSFSFPDTILAVKLNRSRFVVCLERGLLIRSLRARDMCDIFISTTPNPLGLFVLSQNTEKHFVAYPGSSSSGEVTICDTFNIHSESTIAAHENPLAAMAVNETETMIATACDKGTFIRVFDVTERTKLYEFLPGSSCARIYSLCFSQDSNYLSSSSNTEAVHIFRLDSMREEASAEESQGLVSDSDNVVVGQLSQGSTAPTRMLYEDRDFATACLPFSGIRNICALARIQDSLRVLVVSGQSILYIYNVDTVNGGECLLEHKYNLSEWRSSVPEIKPLRIVRVEGFSQHQSAPTDINPAKK